MAGCCQTPLVDVTVEFIGSPVILNVYLKCKKSFDPPSCQCIILRDTDYSEMLNCRNNFLRKLFETAHRSETQPENVDLST